MAGLHFGGGDLSVSLDADQKHDLAGDVHATGELRVGGCNTRDYGSLGGCGEGGARAGNKASGKEKSRRRTE